MNFLEWIEDGLASARRLLRRMLFFASSCALDAVTSSPKYPDWIDMERPPGTVVFPHNPVAPDTPPPADQMCNALCVLGSM